MGTRRVFVIGSSLFAETLTQMLVKAEAVTVVGTAASLSDALPMLQTQCPDAVILAESAQAKGADDLAKFLVIQPDLPLILADLTTDTVQVITSRRVCARTSDVLAVIANLPKQCDSLSSEP